MKNKITLLATLITLLSIQYSCNQSNSLETTFKIAENWKFKSTEDSNWLQATVPGSVHTDLLSNGIIEDPFYRLNERDVQWIDKKDWEYSTTFTVDENTIEKDAIELHFRGLDTYAKVYLNDSLILDANNMFINWEVDCKSIINEGENFLRIIFESPINLGLKKRDQLGYFLPGAENDQSELGGLGDKKVCVFSRKAGYHFGWDWGPRLVTSGIWQEIELNAWDMVKIDELSIIQNELSSSKASLQVKLEIESLVEMNVTLTALIDNQVGHSQPLSLQKGINKIDFPFDILYPQLWWTNGLGSQNLYDIEVQIKDDFNLISSKSANIGLRTIEVVQTPDSVGSSFYFKLNGNPLFIKGANYIPQDVFLNRVEDGDYAHIIKSAVDANINMLRVWGGGIYEKEIFYDLCDQAGILIWQDFMFACAMYPGNSVFLENVEKEAIQNVVRLRNHPCIALWCGDNEILSAWNRWGWKEDVLENQGQDIVDTVWNAYDTVFHTILPSVVNTYDPQRLYWSSSPSAGFGELENGKSGDNHYWGVWWAKEPFSKYEEEIPRFMSEFGFQSFPEFSSVKKYTKQEDWDIYSEVMKSHQRSSIGNVTIEEYMLRDYKKPVNFEMFLYVGQLLQARGIRIGIEAHRRNMPYCMGSLYWQLNDCWPVASWSGIDYYGNWKALHYEVKQAFKQVIISTTMDSSNVITNIISDELADTEALLNISLLDFSGKTLKDINIQIGIQANSSNVYISQSIEKLMGNYDPNKVLLHSKIIQNDSVIDDDIFYFTSPKELELPIPNVKFEIQQIDDFNYTITLSTDVLAKNVYLQNNTGGHFSDNYFDILPTQNKMIIFTSYDKTDVLKLTNQTNLISLIDSY